MLLFYVREALRSFRQHRGLAYTAVLSLTGALSLWGLFLLLAHNAELSMALVGERREMVVYLHDDIDEQDRDALIDRLGELYGRTTFVSKDEAWEELQGQVGSAELLEAVGRNPLPASVRIKLRAELLNAPAMEEAAGQIAEFPEVEDVRYGGEWVRRLDELSLGLRRGAWVVGVTVAIAILFVMYNTIRLTVLARRSQVQIMSRLGASDGFIAMPFVIEAVLQATLSAALALGVVFAFQQTFVSQVVHLAFLPWTWAVAFLLAAILLASIAAGMSLSRVVRKVGA